MRACVSSQSQPHDVVAATGWPTMTTRVGRVAGTISLPARGGENPGCCPVAACRKRAMIRHGSALLHSHFINVFGPVKSIIALSHSPQGKPVFLGKRLSLLLPLGRIVFLVFAYAHRTDENRGLRKAPVLTRNAILILRNCLRLFMHPPLSLCLSGR